MKRLSKALALLLSTVMTVSMLSGCGGSAAPAGTDGSAAANRSGGASGETVMLKWIQIGSMPQNNDAVIAAMNDYTVEKIGIGVDVSYLDWGVWKDKVTAMINSGEYFDMMFTNGDNYTSGINLGAFADLTDLIGDYPALQSYIPDKVWEGVKVNNKIYAIPTYKDSSQTQYWVWDKEIVDKYGFDYQNIHTVEELDPVLYQIQDAINAGEIQNIQYALTIASDGINGFLMNYESPIPALGVRYDDEDLKVVNVFEQEEIMNVLRYMHKWYGDALINPDAATTDQGPKWCIVSSGQGFPGAEVSWASGRGAEVYAEPFAGPIYSTTSILGSVNAISAASKYKAEALKYLELMNTDETLRNMFAYGLEGTDYTKNDDGTITRAENGYNPATYSQASYFGLYPVAPNPADQWDKVKAWNEKATSSVLLGFNFERSSVETEIANCSLIMDRYKKELYTGTRDPEEAVPALYADLEKAGLEAVREEYKKQIDAWKASK